MLIFSVCFPVYHMAEAEEKSICYMYIVCLDAT